MRYAFHPVHHFLILMYPVITMELPTTPPGSRQSLLGAKPSPELVQLIGCQWFL